MVGNTLGLLSFLPPKTFLGAGEVAELDLDCTSGCITSFTLLFEVVEGKLAALFSLVELTVTGNSVVVDVEVGRDDTTEEDASLLRILAVVSTIAPAADSA